ncbi:MAG: hypothetical protein ABIN23_05055 [candidate division WOR-3 bacterium]
MPTYLIRIKEGDLELEIQGDRDFVERKFKEFLKTFFKKFPEKKYIEKEKYEEGDLEKTKDYFKNFKIKSNTEKMLLAARFHYENFGRKSFTLSDIKSIYKIMKWKISKNPSTFLQKFREKNFIYSLPKKRNGKPLYVLTEKGLEFTESLRK